MGDIEWSKLYEATNKDNRPTPGYLFNEIVQNVSYAAPRRIPEVADYLADCVDGDHAHVKLKALFVIKNLAFRVPPFCRCMQDRISSVQDAAAFSGPPSAIYGDEPYRLVREAAESALSALTKGEHYHEQYRAMSQRIVGFGNYLPGEDTLLADGSVNTMRDVGVKDIAMGTLGLLSSGFGSLVGGVTGMLASPFGQENGGLEGLGGDDDLDLDTGHDVDDLEEDPRHDMQDADAEIEEDYRPSAGSYVPPTVPISAPVPEAPEQRVEQQEVDEIEDLFRPDADADVQAETAGTEPPSWAEEDANFFRLLGITSTVGPGEASAVGDERYLAEQDESQVQIGNDVQPSESEILDILGLSGDNLSSSAPATMQESTFIASEVPGISTSAPTTAMPPLVAAAFEEEQQLQQQQQQQHQQQQGLSTSLDVGSLASWPTSVPYPAPQPPLPQEPPPNEESRPTVVVHPDGSMEV